MRKSKFATFVLSLIPGMGHVYLGITTRGVCIMAGFIAWVFSVFIVDGVGLWHSGASELLSVPLLAIWGFSIIDAMNECDRINQGLSASDPSPLEALRDGPDSGKRGEFWILLFSLVPGAGHMYLGWMRKGAELMIMFFGATYLTYSLSLNVFFFTLPVIWFYSFFDALQLASAKQARPQESRPSFVVWSQRSIGIGLIVLGGVILFDRIASPLLNIDYRTLELLRTGIIAALFIAGGVRLAFGSPVRIPLPTKPVETDHPNAPADDGDDDNRKDHGGIDKSKDYGCTDDKEETHK